MLFGYIDAGEKMVSRMGIDTQTHAADIAVAVTHMAPITCSCTL